MTFRAIAFSCMLAVGQLCLPAHAADAPPELIAQIQEDLAKLGYDPGPADGSLSTKTQLAIASFEADNGLPFTGQPSFELAFRIRGAIGAGTAAPAAAPQKSAAELQQECFQQAAAEQQQAKKWNALSNLGTKLAGQIGGYEAAKDVHDAASTVSDVSTVAKEFGISESSAAACMEKYPGATTAGQGGTATATSTSTMAAAAPVAAPPAAAPVAGGSIASLRDECVARAKSDSSFNSCGIACSNAAQYGQSPTADPARRAQLDQFCRERYEATLAVANAKDAETKALQASVDQGAIGSPAPGDYIYTYDFGPHIRLDPPGSRLRAIKVPAAHGKPRLGYPDTFGLEDPQKKNTLTSAQNTAYRVRLNELRIHRTAYIGLLTMHLLEPRYSNTDRTRMYLGGITGGMQAPAEDRLEYQARLLPNMIAQIAVAPDAYGRYFCHAKLNRCHPPTAVQPGAGSTGWGGMMADEFQQRDAFKAFMAEVYDDLLRWGGQMPTEATMVVYANLGEYDFDNGRFPGTIFIGPSNQEQSSNIVTLVRSREDPLASNSAKFELPMSVDDARKLRERLKWPQQRHLYAANPIRFTSAELAQIQGILLNYRSESPRLTLYFDEALTERLAEITVSAP